MGKPVAQSNRPISAGLPVVVLTTSTIAPSGAKCLLPKAIRLNSTGRKSRPRCVGTYSSRGGQDQDTPPFADALQRAGNRAVGFFQALAAHAVHYGPSLS